MEITIRKASLEDCNGIATVHVNSWRTSYDRIVPKEYLENMSYSEREQRWKTMLQENAEPNIVYVAITEEGTIVGFASGGPERSNDPLYDSEMYTIYLLKEYQRQGIGIRLVKAIVEQLAGRFQSMLVWVFADNPARSFYETLGGTWIREDTLTIADKQLNEVAYGWSDIQQLHTRLQGFTHT